MVKRMIVRAFSFFALAVLAGAQVITTVAGTDFVYPNQPLLALQAPIGAIAGLAFDPAGNLYMSDTSNNLVLKMDRQGVVTEFAGNGIVGFSGDGGTATSAALHLRFGGGFQDPSLVDYVTGQFLNPAFAGGLAADSAGNIFIADTGNHRVRKVSSSGLITTIAGNGNAGFAGDGGAATLASLSFPASVAVDASGNVFITDSGNNRVRRVSPSGNISTVAGDGSSFTTQDGKPALETGLVDPAGIAVDKAGDLYICAKILAVNLGFVVKVDTSGIANVILESPLFILGQSPMSPNTRVAVGSCNYSLPDSLAFDTAGDLLVSDYNCHAVYKITANGTAGVTAGLFPWYPGFSGDGGPAARAELNGPLGLAVDPAGNLFIADSGNLRLRIVNLAGIINTVAGNAAYGFGGDGAPAASANLSSPIGVAADGAGGLFIADTFNNRIRYVTPKQNGVISTFAGTGDYSFSGDGGPAVSATLRHPHKVAVGIAGDLLFSDTGNLVVRRVDGVGTIHTVNTEINNLAPFGMQFAVAEDANGDVFSSVGSVVYGEGSNGILNQIGVFETAYDLASDAAGHLLVCAYGDSKVYRVTTDGAATVIAGNGMNGFYYPNLGEGGPATAAALAQPAGVAMDAAGNVYIADSGSNRVRKVTPDGVIHTIAGTGDYDSYGDGGPATAAAVNTPMGVAVDVAGNLYIADSGNNRIREVLANPPAVQVSATSLTFGGQSTGAHAPTQSFNITSVPGLAFSLTVATDSGGNWLSATPQSGGAPRLIDVTADPSNITSAGTYTGAITINTPNANPTATKIQVTFTVSAQQLPTLAPLYPQNFSFAFAKSTPAESQSLTISNAGGGTLNFTVSAAIATPGGIKPITLSQTSGQARPSVPAVITVTADATGLGTGTFPGTVSVTAGATTLSVPVTITVSALDQAILLSQRGLSFTGVAQGGVIPPQTFAVRNIGTGVVSWTAKTVPPMPVNGVTYTTPWLSISPAAGMTDAAQSPPNITVSVNITNLAPGTYYGLVEVGAPKAANSPQVVTVVLQVLASDASTGAVLTPGSLLFATSVGASSPGSQNVLAYNITGLAKSFQSAVSSDPGLSLVTLPANATLDPLIPTPIVVQPFTDGLGVGVYTGTVTLQFDDGRVTRVIVKVIVAAAGSTSPASALRTGARVGHPADTGCVPKTLTPILTAPGDNFQESTGFGVKVGAFVADSCGVPLESGSVTVKPSNGDYTVTLMPQQGGLWEGTWFTQNAALSVNLTIVATNPTLGISGTLQTNGSLASQTPPAFDQSGIISVFGGTTFASLAPGEVISIYGTNLAEIPLATPGFPLQTTLVDTQVTIQGVSLPLYYVGASQVNAVLPYAITGNSLNAPLQIVVQRGDTLSQPVYVTVATAEPTILGSAGAITDYPSDYPASAPYVVSATSPAHAGDTLVLYCLGLGAVNPPVTDGGLPTAAGSQAAATVQALIGNQPATVNQALSPQFPGLYQVNVQIPAGVPKGSSVPVTISAGGQTSPAISIPIQ